MHRWRSLTSVIVAVAAVAATAGPASAHQTDKPAKTIYVDCGAAQGDGGSKGSPFSTITAALPAARSQSVERKVTIAVAEGVCDHETLPILLDFPVRVQGARSPGFDGENRPLNDQAHDTLVTWVSPSPVPQSVSSLAFFRVTGLGVQISALSIDGKIVPGTVAPAQAAIAPAGVLADRAVDFEVDRLRVIRVGVAVRAQGASGRIRDNYLGTVGGGVVLTGGDSTSPPVVIARNNRIEDYWTGALAVGGAGPAGQSIRAVLDDNDTVTTYADTGPSNPFGLRINTKPPGGVSLEGHVDALIESNQFRGSPRYAIIVDGGQLVRRSDDRHYTGALQVSFVANTIDESAITRAASLITFTNSRATEQPCELDPAHTLAECPTLAGNPLQYWEYLEAGLYDLHHTGELDDSLIDHPASDPVDGRGLLNVLIINDQFIDYQTYVVVP